MSSYSVLFFRFAFPLLTNQVTKENATYLGRNAGEKRVWEGDLRHIKKIGIIINQH